MRYKKLFFLVLVYILSIIFILWLINQPFFEDLKEFSYEHRYVTLVLLVLLKIASIIWPPLSGGHFTMLAIPVIGWLASFAANFIGGMIGALIAYYLGRRFGIHLVRKFINESFAERIKKLTITPGKEVEAMFIIRITTTAVAEVVSYSAGMLEVPLRSFLVGTAGGYLFFVPVYYALSNVFAGKNVFINAAPIFLLGITLYILRKRYFGTT